MTVSSVVRKKLCTGCGLCADVCPTSSIQIVIRDGIYLPQINKETCLASKGCDKCYSNCSGKDISRVDARIFGKIKTNNYFYYEKCYTAFSADNQIREKAASGGAVTSFLAFLFEEKHIDAAIVCKNSSSPFFPIATIANNVSELEGSYSSKYCPVNMAGIRSKILASGKRFALVGLPCHIKAFRNDSLAGKGGIKYYVALLCSGNRDFYSHKYLEKKYKICKEKVSSFSYRESGFMGDMVVRYAEDKELRVPFSAYYKRLHSFFLPERCVLCSDHFGDYADISFGDINIPPFNESKKGINSVIVRNKEIVEYIDSGSMKLFLHFCDINDSIILSSQKVLAHNDLLRFAYMKIRLMDTKKEIAFSKGPLTLFAGLIKLLSYFLQRAVKKVYALL